MPVETVFRAEIESVSVLDEQGRFDERLGKDVLPDEDAVRLYEHMSVCREYDMVAFKLQRSGRMGTYPQNWGQEATSTGAAYCMDDADWLVTCYRENAGLFLRGLPMEYVFWHWMGDERGNRIPEGVNVTPLAIPIGTQMLHATGLAWAAKYRGNQAVSVTFFGDGATSEGDFHEAINFATTLEIPVVFCCQNNGWAISTPAKRNAGAPTFAQRGLAYGAHCVQCDGNDLYAVVKVMREAIDAARSDNRVTFVEFVTYRMGDHTTADDARRYRDSAELEAWKQRDPLLRLRMHLERRGVWNAEKQSALEARAKQTVNEIVARAEGVEKPTQADIFDHTFAEIPAGLRAQRDTMHTHSLRIDEPAGMPRG